MEGTRFTFLVGGKAGEGVRRCGSAASRLFSDMGLRTFQMDDYMSLIRGGHNFSVVSASKKILTSHYMKADLVVVMDQRSHDLHKDHLSKDGMLVYDSDSVKTDAGMGVPMRSLAKKYPDPDLIMGVGALAILSASIGFGRDKTQELMRKEFRRETENNVAFAGEIHDKSFPLVGNRFSIPEGDGKRPILTGNEAISLGAAAGGLDIYFAYPMTPSTSVLHFLAARGKELGVVTVHPENEIAVANMAIGAASMGAKAMVGSSGGGFALMEEAFSLAGMTETPLLCVLSSRPGPSTGVPTYTEQGDLRFALHQGHGEFPRIVASPGTVEEAFRLAAEMLNLVWRFQTPGILLTEKHLSESSMTVDIDIDKAKWHEPLTSICGEYKRYLDTENGISPLLFPPSKELIKWNSYEHDERGITSEEPEWLTRMHDKRLRKAETIRKHLESMHTVNVFGEGEPTIATYGSTTMSVLEALRAGNLDARVVQPIYLEPFPVKKFEVLKIKGFVAVEMSAGAHFTKLVEEKTGIKPKATIRKYDGRPFEPVELADELRKVL